MKAYDKEKMKILYEYKESLQDEEIKGIISDFIRNYNIMYVRYKDYLRDKQDRKGMYDQIEKLSKENKDLKEKLERKERLIKLLKEEGHE